MAVIRQDKFEVGDMVTFIEVDEYIGSTIPVNHESRYGKGPYPIEEIETTHSSIWRSAGHTQLVWVNGERFSGFWFNPVR